MIRPLSIHEFLGNDFFPAQIVSSALASDQDESYPPNDQSSNSLQYWTEEDDQMSERKEKPTLCGKKRTRRPKVITVQDRLKVVRKNIRTLNALELRVPKATEERKRWSRNKSAYENRILNYDQDILSLAQNNDRFDVIV